MANPKPIALTQVDEVDYSGPEPKPYVVVGPIPGGGGGGAVDSVNGKTGAVVLSASDVGAAGKTTDNTFTGVNTFNGVTVMPGAAVISTVQVGTLAGPAAVAIKDDGSLTQVLPDSSQSIITFPAVADGGVIATQEWVAAHGGGGAVSSVNTRTGDVVLTKADVGLPNVDNTSDASKPVSTAQATAIAAKVATGTNGPVALHYFATVGAITGVPNGDWVAIP